MRGHSGVGGRWIAWFGYDRWSPALAAQSVVTSPRCAEYVAVFGIACLGYDRWSLVLVHLLVVTSPKLWLMYVVIVVAVGCQCCRVVAVEGVPTGVRVGL